MSHRGWTRDAESGAWVIEVPAMRASVHATDAGWIGFVDDGARKRRVPAGPYRDAEGARTAALRLAQRMVQQAADGGGSSDDDDG